MKNILACLALLAAPLFATNYALPQVIGFLPSNTPNTSTTALSTASNAGLWAFSYIPPANVTLQNVWIDISAVTGTLAATDMKLDVYNDNGAGSSKPGTTQANSTTSSQQTAGFIKWGGSGTGYNFAMTANTVYWLVLSNQNGTPTSNFPTVKYGASGSAFPSGGTSACQYCAWQIGTSTNTGTSWTITNNSAPWVRLDFTDGSFAGNGITAVANDTTNNVFAAREVGNQIVTQGVQLNVRGIAASVGRTSSPTGNMRFGIWNCSGLVTCVNLGYTATTSQANLLTGGVFVQSYFPTVVTIPANTTAIITLGEASNADTNSKTYNLVSATIDNTSGSLALKPLGGTNTQGAYCTATCTTYSNWALAPTTVYGFQLILDSTAEFTPIPVSAPISQ